MANTTTNWSIRGMISAAIVAGTMAGAQATLVYDQFVTGSNLAGSRSLAVNGGLMNIGGNVSSATLSWEIGYDTNTTRWSYSYTFTHNSQQGISHFILDLSDNCTAGSGCIIGFRDNSTSADALIFSTFTTNGNPGFPGSITGVKFDDLSAPSSYTFSFQSERAPVWGDFYAKGGSPENRRNPTGFAIFNDGADEHLTSTDVIDFIARPDTVTGPGPGPSGAADPVPAPASLLLLGAGLLGLAASRKRSA